MSDISNSLGGIGVALEAKAFNTFGAAVQDHASGGLLGGITDKVPFLGSLTKLGSKITGTNRNGEETDVLPDHGVWDPSPYASAFASGHGGLDPKTKFIFKVYFVLSEGAKKEASTLLGGKSSDDLTKFLTFTIKKIDLPKYTFEYEEINFYNYRTKVLKRINHEPLSFTLYDTTGNQAQDFLNMYLNLLVPLSRRKWGNENLQDYGMEFSRDRFGLNSSMRQVIQGNERNILSSIIIEQFYLDRTLTNISKTQIRQAIKMNKFTFLNPKITKFDLEDQDHEAADVGTIHCDFDFDALHMDFSLAGDLDKDDILGPNDILAGNPVTKKPIHSAGLGGKLGFLAPFVGIIANQVASKLSTKLGSVIGKSGLSNVGGGALRGTINSVSAGSTGFLANTIAGATVLGVSGVVNSISTIGSKHKVVDSAASQQVADKNSQ